MVKTAIISVNPNSSFAPVATGELSRRIYTGTSASALDNLAVETSLVKLMFPSRDAGLNISLTQLALRILVAFESGFISVEGIISGSADYWISICILGWSFLLLFGFLVRLAALGLGIFYIIFVSDFEGASCIGFILSAASFASAIIGGGWFAIDYHLGHKISRLLKKRKANRRLSYRAFSYD